MILATAYSMNIQYTVSKEQNVDYNITEKETEFLSRRKQ